MFESDDFDQVLSQFDLPEECNKRSSTGGVDGMQKNLICNTSKSPNKFVPNVSSSTALLIENIDTVQNNRPYNVESNLVQINNVSPQHCKRKIIKSHFDSHCKRKFPGPAGLLTGNFGEYKDDTVGHVEFLSQDIDFSQNPLQRGLFESTLWKKLSHDLKNWNISSIESIKSVKQPPALDRNLKCRKAQTITAFVECVDRSAMDPLVILRDLTGNIKCTLHRDAWSHFSSYIVPECCALILCKPTVLTTGGAFKKHYLNITLSNILAIYSSIIVQDEENSPVGYEKFTDENCTVFRMEKQNKDLHQPIQSEQQTSIPPRHDLFEDLDSVFCDDIF